MDLISFQNKLLKEIRWWAGAAAILPLIGLAGIFFVWAFGIDEIYSIAMVIGATTMFAIAVIWWWWALYSLRILVCNMTSATDKVVEVIDEVREISIIVRDIIPPLSDK